MPSAELQFWRIWAEGCVARSMPVCLAYSDNAASRMDSKVEELFAVEDIGRRDGGRKGEKRGGRVERSTPQGVAVYP